MAHVNTNPHIFGSIIVDVAETSVQVTCTAKHYWLSFVLFLIHNMNLFFTIPTVLLAFPPDFQSKHILHSSPSGMLSNPPLIIHKKSLSEHIFSENMPNDCWVTQHFLSLTSCFSSCSQRLERWWVILTRYSLLIGLTCICQDQVIISHDFPALIAKTDLPLSG